MSEALTDAQVRETRQIAQLEVRAYFDHYLEKILPAQQKAARAHTHILIEAHDASDKAHGGVEARVNKARWVILGWIIAGAGGGLGLAKLISSLGWGLFGPI